MKYHFVITFFLISIFSSCNSYQENKKLQAEDSILKEQLKPKAAAKNIITFKGLYTSGNQENTFLDCGTGQKVRVNDTAGLMKLPYQKAIQSFSYPNESAYAEVKGYLSGKSNPGYASEYENVLVITEVIEVSAKYFRTECYQYEFIAIGNEPFWSVDIIPNEELIVLKDVAESKVYLFPYRPGVTSGTSIRYQTGNDLKETLTIQIKKEDCSDGMSDNVYFYSAEVNINGRELKGCAIKKGDIIRQN